jgi:hypothetical protein
MILASYPRNRPWRPIGMGAIRISHCLGNMLTDVGKVVNLTYIFLLLVLIFVRG